MTLDLRSRICSGIRSQASSEARVVLTRCLELIKPLPGPTPETPSEFAALLVLASRWKVELNESARQRNQKLFVRCVHLRIDLNCDTEGRRLALMVAAASVLSLPVPALLTSFEAFPGADVGSAIAVIGEKAEAFFAGQRAKRVEQEKIRATMAELIPKGLSLFDHQLEGLRWCRDEANWRGLIADDRGLGKTVEALTALLLAQHEGVDIFPVCVVAPRSMQVTWCREARTWLGDGCRIVRSIKGVDHRSQDLELLQEKFSRGGRRGARVLDGVDPVLAQAVRRGMSLKEWLEKPLVMVVTAARFRLNAEQLVNAPWGSFIWDEYDQYLIRESSSTAMTFNMAMQRAKPVLRLALSGTSIPNGRPMGLFTILRLLDRLEGPLRRRRTYGHAFCRGKPKIIGRKPTGEPKWAVDFDGRSDPIGFARRVLREAQIRRTKAEARIKGLPPKVRTRVDVECTWRDRRDLARAEDEAKALTQRLAQELEIQLIDEGFPEEHIEERIYRALMAEASRVHARIRRVLGQIKARFVAQFIQELWGQGERPLLFCDLTDTAATVHEELLKVSKKARVDAGDIWVDTGKSSDKRRQGRMDAWQAGKGSAWVLTRAFSSGITLTSSRIVVFVERFWDPKWELQAEDRVHRIGQTESCSIYVLHVPDSLDDDMDRLAQWKESGMEGLQGNPWHRVLKVKPSSTLALRGRS